MFRLRREGSSFSKFCSRCDIASLNRKFKNVTTAFQFQIWAASIRGYLVKVDNLLFRKFFEVSLLVKLPEQLSEQVTT